MDKILMTPGPTNIPSGVFEAMSRNMHHRTDEFKEIMDRVNTNLMELFGTKNEVIILASSGTAGLEASIVNVFSPKDKLLVVNCGVFGKRFADIARIYDVDVDEIKVEWGFGIEKDVLEGKIKSGGYKAVYVTYSETSTGVKNNIKELGVMIKNYGCLFIVDIVSALGCLEFNAEDFSVDIAIAGSQKGLMCPPGLSMISISDRAWDIINKSTTQRFYFDLRKYKNNALPYTPAVSLILGMDRSLNMIKEEGIDNILNRHRLYSVAVKNACSSMGLLEFPDVKYHSEVLTAFLIPDGIEAKMMTKHMDDLGIVIAGGQGQLKGRIIRIGHMGYMPVEYITRTVNGLSNSLNELGYKNNTKNALDEIEKILGV